MKKKENKEWENPPKVNLKALNKRIEKQADDIFAAMLSNLMNKKDKIKEKDPKALTNEEKEILKGNDVQYFTKIYENLEKKQTVKNIEEITDLNQLQPYLPDIKDEPVKKNVINKNVK